MAAALSPTPALDFLAVEERKELLRFLTCGSVDDGKSTLIGRLLYDTQGVYEDQLASVQKSKVNRAQRGIDLSLLTDGLRAEREQGITIDVAYRYFATPKRKFIIADTPGHEQYTRNMATGASTCQLAVVLIDARHGVLPQSRRHAFIASLLAIPYVAVAINKMDLVDFSEARFHEIRAEFQQFLDRLHFRQVEFLPVSALDGDNVVYRGGNMPWYAGPTLLDVLESVPLNRHEAALPFRLPVQHVIRPDLTFRGYAGQIASGTVRPGDTVMVLPSGRTSKVKSLPAYSGDLPEASAPLSVVVTLEDEIDISRGDMLVPPQSLPHVSARLEASVVWMVDEPLRLDRPYLLKHTTRRVQATVTAVKHRADIHSLEHLPAESLGLNEIGQVVIETSQPLYFDPYRANRATGSFVLIDPQTNATVAAGMMVAPAEARRKRYDSEHSIEAGPVTPVERQVRHGHPARLLWVGDRLALATLLERRLFSRGADVIALAGEAATADALEALLGAGLLVITASAAQPQSGLLLPLPPLDQNDELAARQVLAALGAAGFAQGHDEMTPGEGI